VNGGNVYIKSNSKKCLSQGKMAFREPHGNRTILALKNETIWSGFLWYLAAPLGKGYVHYVASRPNTLKALRL